MYSIQVAVTLLTSHEERVILSRVQMRAPMVLKPRPIPMPAEIGFSLPSHCRPSVFLVPFRRDLARMNGTPQPNQRIPPALGIEPGLSNTSLNT